MAAFMALWRGLFEKQAPAAPVRVETPAAVADPLLIPSAPPVLPMQPKMAAAMASRGYRNKNPGNIEATPGKPWDGQMAQEVGNGSRFPTFITHEHGIRALALNLMAYQNKHGLKTVRGIINRWAPPVENDTSSYVRGVSHHMGIGPDDSVDLSRLGAMTPMVEAIITHELGGNPYPASVIAKGLGMAGITR